jgi:hypothetical protein
MVVYRLPTTGIEALARAGDPDVLAWAQRTTTETLPAQLTQPSFSTLMLG